MKRFSRHATIAMGALALLPLLASAWALGSCGPPPGKPTSASPKASASGSSKVVVAKLSPPPGVDLVAACTPSGPELCFNAIDDNCNGVIDEGCGIATGLLQFTIAWSEAAADVDLVVSGPNGERLSAQNRSTPSGLRFDHDCPKENCGGQNLENVHFDGMDPSKGRYSVDIVLADLPAGVEPPVKVRFGARVGSRTYGADVLLSKEDNKKSFGFEL